jgi:hypothetical protein
MRAIPCAILLCAASAWAERLPACVEASNGPSDVQRFHFDDSSTLTLREAFYAGQPIGRDRFVWGASTLEVITERPGGRGESKFEESATGGLRPMRDSTDNHKTVATFKLGSHGELLEMIDKPDETKLTWNGTFAKAEPRPFFEGLYIGAAAHVLLPRHTAERGIFTRMRPFLFTGTVTLVDNRANRGRREEVTQVAEYRDGKMQRLSYGDHVITFTWKGDQLERETYADKGPDTLEIHYTYKGKHLIHSELRASDYTRDVRYTYASHGLSHIDTTLGNAKESGHDSVDLRPCK